MKTIKLIKRATNSKLADLSNEQLERIGELALMN